jgi:hypothetical protein
MFSMRTTTLRRRLALLAAVTAIVGLSTGATMASAQAAPTTKTSATAPGVGLESHSGRRMVAPAAPEAAARTSLLAASPGVSPPVNSIHVAPGQSYICYVGSLCTTVWDPTTSDWKAFGFYYCNTYSLSNWNGYGNWINVQTGGAWAYAYDQSGTTIDAFQAGYQGTAYWSPAWYIKNC